MEVYPDELESFVRHVNAEPSFFQRLLIHKVDVLEPLLEDHRLIFLKLVEVEALLSEGLVQQIQGAGVLGNELQACIDVACLVANDPRLVLLAWQVGIVELSLVSTVLSIRQAVLLAN